MKKTDEAGLNRTRLFHARHGLSPVEPNQRTVILDINGFLLLVALLAFSAGALWKPLRALWGFISRRQALGWWTRKPIRLRSMTLAR